MDNVGKIAGQISGKIIGKRKYEALKSYDLDNMDEKALESFNFQFKGLTVAEALKQISDYEQKFNFNTKNQAKKIGDHFEKIFAPEKPKVKKELTKEILWKLFNVNYTRQNSKKNKIVNYSDDPTIIENIKPLIYYFIGDIENFKKCPHLSFESEPEQNKGLLIVGSYGAGKTSSIKALQSSMAKTNNPFKTINTNDMVSEYEGLQYQDEKDFFWKKYNTKVWCFDDLLTERTANNYGKVEVMKDILETREYRGLRTYATMNYKDGTENNLNEALQQIGEKYGSRAYDRIFSMFNIIEFKGKSFRK